MKIERTKNATRNIVYGVILKIYQLLIPFIMRTAMIYIMGTKYLGLGSLFTSILSVLNLTELGVGFAMVFSMYKPIAEDDEEKICALMRLYKLYYNVIGLVILVVGIAITPIIPHLVKGEIPDGISLIVLYYLNLCCTVLSYWLFAYKSSLLQAHQRLDITSKVTMVNSTLLYVLQIGAIFLRNYYLYVIVGLFTTALGNICTAVIVDRMYPQYKAKGKLPKQEVKAINRRIKDLFTAKLGSVIVGSVDSIVISAFIGLSTLGVYNNYYYIMSSVMGFITIIFNSCLAGIGNSIVTESREKNYNDFKLMSFIVGWIMAVCIPCFLCLYQPFMKLWVKYKENMLPDDTIILFCVYFFVCEISMVWATYKDAAGIWHEDRFRPLIGALANLFMNIVFVKAFDMGIYGILLSTILSYIFISMPWLIHNLFHRVFQRSYLEYIKEIVKLLFMILIICVASYFICFNIKCNLIVQLVVKGIACLIVSNIIIVLTYFRTNEFHRAKSIFMGMILRKRG